MIHASQHCRFVVTAGVILYNLSRESSLTGLACKLQDKSQSSSSLKIPALTFLRTALESTDASIWQSDLPSLSQAIFATVGERYFKVTAQALRATERLVYVLRPQQQAQIPKTNLVCCLLHSLVGLQTSVGMICAVQLCIMPEHSQE